MLRCSLAAILVAAVLPLATFSTAKAADLDYPDAPPPPVEQPLPPPPAAPIYVPPRPVAPVYVVPRPVVYPAPVIYPRPYWRPYWRPAAPGCGYYGRCFGYRPY